MEEKKKLPQVVRVVAPKARGQINEELVNAVIAAAVWSVERRPGNGQNMLEAMNQGAATTKEGTVNAFLFRAMVDRLLEEYHTLHMEQARTESDF